MKKSKFSKWLDSQPRNLLTFDENVYKQGNGWSAEEFSLEARKRGVMVPVTTAYSWRNRKFAMQPRTWYLISKAFPGVQF